MLFSLFYEEKSSDYAEEVDDSILRRSTPPHPHRCHEYYLLMSNGGCYNLIILQIFFVAHRIVREQKIFVRSYNDIT